MITAVVAPLNSPGFYEITLTDRNGCLVVVSRTLQSLKELSAKLSAANYLSSDVEPQFPQHANPEVLQLQSYLNNWLNYYTESQDVTDALTDFMEDTPGQSVVTQLQFNALKEKIARLTEMNRQYESALSAMVLKSSQLSDMVTMLQMKLGGSSSSSFDEDCPVRTDRFPSEASELRGNPVPTITLSSPSEEQREMSLQFPVATAEYAEASNLDDETPRPQSASGGGKPAFSQAEIRNNADMLWRAGQAEQQAQRFDSAVQEVLSFVQPHPSQITYRASVVALIKRQVRSVLRVNAFECSLHVLRCFLPDDPTRLTVILGRTRVAQWHKTLHDRLTVLAEQPELSRAACPVDDDFAVDGDDEFPLFDHVLSKVQVASEDANFKVDCVVDAIESSISCNRRGDICLLAFVEEFANLVGQDDLFKRLLQLIRAWWFYETATYAGASIRHYIPDSAMCIMVCAIFNQFHMRISSPLQALCLFLAEYSAYDGATQAITLQGIVPFKSATSSQPLLLDAQPSHLVSCEIIEKYWNLFNLSSASADSTGYENIIRSTSSDDYFQDDTNGLSIAAASAVVLSVDHDRSAPGGIEKINMKNLSSHNLHYFERQLFSVVHPFCHTNMVQEKLSSRRQMRLHKAFQIGASEMTVYLKQSTHNANNAKDILNYFPSVLARFDEVFAHNKTFLPTAAESVVDPRYYSNAEKLASSIMYCNLMLESVLSEPALLTLSTEILAVKGPLPVGEIGKLLAETTSIGSLSQKLKERFGGLKKFLERFPTAFVLSNDHPFNPSVLLRSSLSAEHRDLIDRGIFPHQLLQKTKKAAAPAKKKKSPGPDFNTSGNLISSSGSPSSNQGSPFLGVQAHKFMTSPSLTLTHAKYITNNNGVNGVNINKNPMNSPPAVQQHKLARISSFPNQFPPPNSGPQQQNQQQLQQQQQQQQQHNNSATLPVHHN
mmetsp:Transcript_62742/g.110844  ORF Transcript_62742/g.110844 Transcript_62742/m.110844 type:complete len:946 (-) Transcript_62742:155-2992(-)